MNPSLSSPDHQQPWLVIGYSLQTAKRVTLFLFAVELLMLFAYILLHVVVSTPGWWNVLRPILNVDNEVSIPTWFSSIQLFALGFLLLVQSSRFSQFRVLLCVAGIGFLYLSMDEGAAVHDRIYDLARNRPPFVGVPFLAWIVPYLFVGFVIVLAMSRSIFSFWRHFRRESTIAVAGAVVFVTGGIVLEMLSHYILATASRATFLLTVGAEEFCEMAGVTLMLHSVMLLGLRSGTSLSGTSLDVFVEAGPGAGPSRVQRRHEGGRAAHQMAGARSVAHD